MFCVLDNWKQFCVRIVADTIMVFRAEIVD